MHLLIPFASSAAPAQDPELRGLHLPWLEKLLRRLMLLNTDAGSADSLSPPHERVLAQAYGMSAPDGRIAWAAREARQSGRHPADCAWAWISPVHWDVGSDHITMAAPHTPGLREAESRELLGAMQPFFAGDGIVLEYAHAHRWLAHGAVFDRLASASLDRVEGRDIGAWMPSAAGLRRLQNEMQMLLYTHPVNDARLARGVPTVNSFWVSASGRLPAEARTSADEEPTVACGLRDAALQGDWAAWARNWADIDRQQCQPLLHTLAGGGDVVLTLCGERNALSFGPARDGLIARLKRRLHPATLKDLHGQL